MRFLLDTNILSALVRDPHGRIAAKIKKVGEGSVCTSIIVAAELSYGAEKKRSVGLSTAIQGLLATIEVLPFESPAESFYAEIRAQVERIGRPVGANDLLIAAHALSLGFTLVTDNEKEFSHIQKLRVENWLRKT